MLLSDLLSVEKNICKYKSTKTLAESAWGRRANVRVVSLNESFAPYFLEKAYDLER